MSSKIRTPTTTTTTATTLTTTTTTTTQDDKELHILVDIGCICFITVNAVVALVRAHSQGHLSSVMAQVVFMYFSSVSIICCCMALSRMPIEEESSKKDFLRIMLLVLSMILVFGVTFHLSTFIGTIATVTIWVVMAVIYAFAFFLLCTDYCCYDKDCKKPLMAASPASKKACCDHKNNMKATDEPSSLLETV